MAKVRQVRWTCPNGIHPGVLGPTRPRKDNIVRYCLPCSQKAGRLIERNAPALEKSRTEQQAKTQARARVRVEREEAKQREYYTVAGLDLREEMKRFAALKQFGGKRGRLYRDQPTLTITRRSYIPTSRFGAADPWENRVWISAYPGITQGDVRETLLHELVHIYVGYSPSDKRHWHGKKFRANLREACKEAFGFYPSFGDNIYHGKIASRLDQETAA